ncbi:hypothetical protein ABFS83_02G092700 [Erythranthe nasuta]
MTPFEAVYGRPPPPLVHYTPGSAVVHEVDQTFGSRAEILKELHNNLAAARNRMKQVADRHRLYLKLQSYRQHPLLQRVYQKLASRFYGPFRMLERICPVAYRLELQTDARIHPVSHVSLLRQKLGEHTPVVPILPPFMADSGPIVEPEKILARRKVMQTCGEVHEVSVKWISLEEEEATWEAEGELKKKFPPFPLEANAVSEGVGNDAIRRSLRTPKPNQRYID